MCEEQDESIKRFLEQLKMPKREKSKQTTSSQYRAKQAILDLLNERSRKRQEKKTAKNES